MAISGLLGHALTDPATGLPSLPYFSIVRDWEARRAQRRSYLVKVLRLKLRGPADRTLGWRLCQELRTSDLIASEGGQNYRILLTSPDAEKATAIAARIRVMIENLNAKRGTDPISAELTVEADEAVGENAGPWGPCKPNKGECDER